MASEQSLLKHFLDEWESDTPHIRAHTSGSTGTPKEILLPRSDMEASARATCRRFGIDKDSMLWLPLSINYIAGKMMVVRSIISGARLILESPSRHVLTTSPADRVTLMAIVPSQVDSLLASPHAGMVDNVIVGGAPLTSTAEASLAGAPFHAYATYGMTETCSHVALRDITSGEKFFTAMPSVTFARDSRGCLVINAPGYSFGTLVTNDMVELIDESHFIWKGRVDAVINSGGVKVHPEEVESILRSVMGSAGYMITSRKSDEWGQEVILKVAGACDTEKIMAFCRDNLSPAQRPKEIIRVTEIPLTSNGKIRRQ